MGKNLLMPERFCTDVYKLILALERVDLPSECIDLCKRLEAELTEKVARMERRDNFTRYKTSAPGTDERAQARTDYLDAAGIGEKWRTDKEVGKNGK